MRRPAFWLALSLMFVPAVLATYRIIFLGYPLLPTAPIKAWQLTMDAQIEGSTREVSVKIGLPSSLAALMITEERITSGPLGFNLLREGPNQIGVWSGMVTKAQETVTYRATLIERTPGLSKPPSPPPPPDSQGFVQSEWSLARRLVEKWDHLPAQERLRVVLMTVKGVWEPPLPRDKDTKAWALLQEKRGLTMALLLLLRAVGLPARVVEGLQLVESVTSAPLQWIEVWTDKEWQKINPGAGEIYGKALSFLPLTIGGVPTIRIFQGNLIGPRWTLSREIVSQWRLHFEWIMRSNRFLDRWSLFHLPEEFQGTFRILILVPIGALMICALRNLVGFPTFGIFMPVLMALAFRNTGLLYGLCIFAGVVWLGYLIRRWVNRLRLLLVPRLSLLLTLVIVSFLALALVGSKLGVRSFMAVGLLPFVILTMTIERFFVIMEEAGSREALRTAVGSAAVAAITHEIIHFEPLQLTFFLYPELLLVVAATQVLLGRYTGYRLSELVRFRALRRSP